MLISMKHEFRSLANSPVHTTAKYTAFTIGGITTVPVKACVCFWTTPVIAPYPKPVTTCPIMLHQPTRPEFFHILDFTVADTMFACFSKAKWIGRGYPSCPQPLKEDSYVMLVSLTEQPEPDRRPEQ